MSGYGPCARPRDYLSWLTLVWLHGMLIPLRNSLRAALAGGDKRKLDLPTLDIHVMPRRSLSGAAGMGPGTSLR
jgi:hypothetical protein